MDNQQSEKLAKNKQSWNKAIGSFVGWCALPTWGPFEVAADDPTLIGDIKDKTFLEVCCGSGHSTKYLLEHGAKKVYALDFSDEQIKTATRLNQEYVQKGMAVFFQGPMEEKIDLPEQVDTVFSVYGVGWTIDPDKTLAHIHSYLKKGGKFVWSWDNPMFENVKQVGDQIVVNHSYFDESEIFLADFEGSGGVYISNRKVSTWFEYLTKAGFRVTRFLEPTLYNPNEDIASVSSPEMAKYYNKNKAEKIPPTMIFECVKE